MQQALQLARHARANNEVPIGAVVVVDDEIIGRGANAMISLSDPTAHAEIVALRQAAAVCGNYRLANASLFVTVEPCTMCVGAMVHARVDRLVFGASEARAGAVMSQLSLCDQSCYNHRIDWQAGILEADCAQLMRDFFADKRKPV